MATRKIVWSPIRNERGTVVCFERRYEDDMPATKDWIPDDVMREWEKEPGNVIQPKVVSIDSPGKGRLIERTLELNRQRAPA